MSKYTIVPSNLRYKGAPSVDEEIDITLEEQSQQITEYDRSTTISLAQVYDDERQRCTIFRPTFKVTYLYANTYTGTTGYLPFQYNLYYTTPENSKSSSQNGGGGKWPGFPQYYEFDFFRPDVSDQHFVYKSKSAYTYNWTYYLTYPYENNYDKELTYYSTSTNDVNWKASQGIPFSILNSTNNGNGLIAFNCIAPHGLTEGEYVELSLTYRNSNIFQVYSIGNGLFGSDEYVFNVLNIGYTGTTFSNNTIGTFRRVINPDNLTETTSKYYVKQNKVLTNLTDIDMVKAGFEKNVFNEERKLEYSSITPNNLTRISQKTSSNTYNATSNYDLDFVGLKDNQKRPISEIYFTVVNKGYSGYFNSPQNGVGLKQGWEFNLSKTTNPWWNLSNEKSNTNIPVSAYTLTNGETKTFYYNLDLQKGDVMDGDFCEWNDYEQVERVVSPYYHKLKFNQTVFQTTTVATTNAPGYYYKPHNKMTIKVFSDYVETGGVAFIDQVPEWSFYSMTDQQFRWRDLYTYGFKDNFGRGVDYPYLNMAHYPYANVNFRLIPEGINYNDNLTGYDFSFKPLIDNCE
jgi:hypothetical protein